MTSDTPRAGGETEPERVDDGWLRRLASGPRYVTERECEVLRAALARLAWLESRAIKPAPAAWPAAAAAAEWLSMIRSHATKELAAAELAEIIARHAPSPREHAALLELLREVSYCGVEQDDARLDYLTVQIGRTLWDDIRAALPAEHGAGAQT